MALNLSAMFMGGYLAVRHPLKTAFPKLYRCCEDKFVLVRSFSFLISLKHHLCFLFALRGCKKRHKNKAGNIPAYALAHSCVQKKVFYSYKDSFLISLLLASTLCSETPCFVQASSVSHEMKHPCM